MKKLLLTIALLFAFSGGLKAQEIKKHESFEQPFYSWYAPDVDSVEVNTSGWADFSLLDNSSLYLTTLFSGTGTPSNDSATLIIQGRTKYITNTGAVAYLQTNVDTLLIIGHATIPTQTLLTLTSFHPEYRFVITTVAGGTGTDNANNRTFSATLYSRKRDHELFQHKKYGNYGE